MGDVCLACGMCCDGTLGFAHAVVTAEEGERLAARSLPIAGLQLRQPCAAFAGSRCAVYADRPGVCAHYRCTVLKAVDAGTMTSDAALGLVARARALAASVRAQVPGAGGLWRDLDGYIEDTVAWRRAHAELLLDVVLLRELVRRFDESAHRRTAPGGAGSPVGEVGEDRPAHGGELGELAPVGEPGDGHR